MDLIEAGSLNVYFQNYDIPLLSHLERPWVPYIHTVAFPEQNFLKCIWVLHGCHGHWPLHTMGPLHVLLLLSSQSGELLLFQQIPAQEPGFQPHFPGSSWLDVIAAIPRHCYHWSRGLLHCLWVTHSSLTADISTQRLQCNTCSMHMATFQSVKGHHLSNQSYSSTQLDP